MTRNYLRKKYSDEELKQLLIDHMSKGYTVKQIADAIGSTERSVGRWKGEFGLTIKPLSVASDDILNDHALGMTANDIAKKHDVSVETICNRLAKNGIELCRVSGIRRKNQQKHDRLWPDIENDLNKGFMKSEIITKYKISAPSLNTLMQRKNYTPTFVGDLSTVNDLLDNAQMIQNAKKKRATIDYLTSYIDYVEMYQVLPTLSDLSRFMSKPIQTVTSWFKSNNLSHLLSQHKHMSYNVRTICNHLTQLGVLFELNDRQLIKPFEIDIWVPDYNLGIEVNPTTTHSVATHVGLRSVDRNYHQMKSLLCFDKGIKLAHIYDWDDISIESIRSLLFDEPDVTLCDDTLVLDLNKLLVTKKDLHEYNIHQCSVVEPVEYFVNRNSCKITENIDRNTISVYDAGKLVCERNM